MGAPYLPTILLPGIGQNLVAYTGEDKKFSSAWPPPLDADVLKKEFMGAILKMTLFHKDAGFSDKVAKLAAEAAEPFAAEADGSLRYAASLAPGSYSSLDKASDKQKANVYKFAPLQPLTAITGEDRLFFFAFNFAEDPLVTAEKLHAYVQLVKEESGCEQVNLLPVGFSAPVVLAYLHKYGDCGDLHRVIFFFGAPDGSLLLTDVMTDSLVYAGFTDAVAQLAGEKNASMLADLNKMIPGLADTIAQKSVAALREKLLLRLPMVWSLVPADDYEELAATLLAGADPALREKTDRFQAVRRAFPETLLRLRQSGTEVFSLCGCGSRLLSLTPSQDVSSDGLINTSSAALNAGIPEVAEPAQYKIDPAAGALPDTTWYFYGVQHMAAWHTPEVLSLVVRLLTEDSLADISSPDAPPQLQGAIPTV